MARKPADMTTKYTLSERELPTKWYNIQADLKTPLPPVMHPGTGQPIGPQDLAPLFPMELIKQEVSQERWIEIPDEVRDILRLWRPSPLHRARRLERALDTPAQWDRVWPSSLRSSPRSSSAIRECCLLSHSSDSCSTTWAMASRWKA